METAASAPGKAMNSITLQWGLISLPLSIYKATEDIAIARKEFYGDEPVGRQYIVKRTGDVIEYSDVEKRALASNGTWVALTDAEIAQATGNRERCEVITFIPMSAIGTQYAAEGIDYVRPKRYKGRSLCDEPFALLMAAMAQTGTAALLRLALRGPARFAALTSEGTLIYLAPVQALREAPPLPSVAADSKVLAVAVTFIETTGITTPTLSNDNPAKVQDFIDAKAAGKAPSALEKAAPVNNGADIMESLMASIAQQEAKKIVRKRTTKKGAA